MRSSLATTLVLLFCFSESVVSRHRQEVQVVIAPPTDNPAAKHVTEEAIHAAIETYPDPVDALIALHPEAAPGLSAPKLIQVVGEEAAWMTEGDKLRLRRSGKKFMDITDYHELYESIDTATGKASTQNYIIRLPVHCPILTDLWYRPAQAISPTTCQASLSENLYQANAR